MLTEENLAAIEKRHRSEGKEFYDHIPSRRILSMTSKLG